MKTFVLGDKHGGYKAMLQVFQRSGFNPDTDRLIDLGDVVDGWSQTYECVELLLSCKNLISIKGNHDDWWLKYLTTGKHPANLSHGARATLQSYIDNCPASDGIIPFTCPESHLQFYENQLPYYKDSANNVFVHGGWNRHFNLAEQPVSDIYWWDRDLFLQSLSAGTISNEKYNVLRFKDLDINKIFIGHTPTTNWKEKETVSNSGIILSQKGQPKTIPMFADKIVNIDTGAAFDGKLTLMDIDTLQYWQSDTVRDLYPNEKGRN